MTTSDRVADSIAMASPAPPPNPASPHLGSNAAARAEREAAALRENLRRRKAASEPPAPPEPKPDVSECP